MNLKSDTKYFLEVTALMWTIGFLLLGGFLAACQPQAGSFALAVPEESIDSAEEEANPANPQITPPSTRPPYSPGELVAYTVQSGDTMPALASRFNTNVEEIREANPIIPEDTTTLPPGMPMEIPIYYEPLWGTPYQIIPDSHFTNGPHQVGFDTTLFVNDQPGWLNGYVEYASGDNRTGAEIVDLVAANFSISPRLLLALIEYQAGGLSLATPPGGEEDYILGNVDWQHRGLYLQLVWAANTLNNGYYIWRGGDLESIVHQDGSIERPDPWQNAGTVALQYYFSMLFSPQEYNLAVSSEGLAATYLSLFGDPWDNAQALLPGSLTQPELSLPFEPGEVWAYTGGPHTGWGTGEPLAALDFAPPSVVGGCVSSNEWVTAVAPGLVVRSEPGIVTLDLDEDGDERTGWVIFYLHVASKDRVRVGGRLELGDKVGHPSCEGGTSTGTHIHIARKYNGEWILAEGPLAFNLEGWVANNGDEPYLGTLTRFSSVVTACLCSDSDSFISAAERE